MALVCAAVGGMGYLRTADLPEKVYALRSSCDTDDNSVSLFLTPQQAEQMRTEDKVWLLNYKDGKTPMLEFEGRIIAAEKLRGTVSSIVWCGIAGGVLTLLVLKKRNEGKTNEE